MATPLPDVAHIGDERTMLVHYLEFYRAVARRKAESLTDAQLRFTLPGHPSTLTIGGLLFHLASVEDWWFQRTIAGRGVPEPWANGWAGDGEDYDFRAEGRSAADILSQFDASVAASRAVLGGVASLDDLSAEGDREGNPFSVRWILLHLVEEYARHAGHLDLLREAVDGATGD